MPQTSLVHFKKYKGKNYEGIEWFIFSSRRNIAKLMSLTKTDVMN